MHSQLEVQKCGFEANIIENHDEPRGASRFLPKYAQTPSGIKMLGTISLLLRGIPFIYQGQEIGMKNAEWNSIAEYDDISTKDQYYVAREAGLSDKEALEVCGAMSRDNARTPMQWSDAEHAGFTTGTPWLKVNANYKEINVNTQEKNPYSVLNYYRKLVALRKSAAFKELFTYGAFIPAYKNLNGIMAFYREDESTRVLIATNFGIEPVKIELEYTPKRVLLSNRENETTNPTRNTIKLNSCDAIVIELAK